MLGFSLFSTDCRMNKLALLVKLKTSTELFAVLRVTNGKNERKA
jgi:hypothetical protein